MDTFTAGLIGLGVYCVSLYRGADLADKYLPITSLWTGLLGSFGVHLAALVLGHLATRIALKVF